MQTQTQIVKGFDRVSADLQLRGFTVQSNSNFLLLENGQQVFQTATIDGLFGFLAALHHTGAR